MQKILDYIKNGKGIGVSFILLLSVLAACYSAYGAHQVFPKLVPHIQNFTDTFLPLKIQNHKIVMPENTIIEKTYQINNEPILFKMDTTRDLLEEDNAQTGIYLTRSYFYSVAPDNVQRRILPETLNIEKQDYTPFLNEFFGYLVWGILFLAPIFNFAFFMLAVVFYAWLTSFACTLNKTTLPFKTKMRLNTVLFIAVYLLSTLCYTVGLNLSLISFFLIMLALQIICVKKVHI